MTHIVKLARTPEGDYYAHELVDGRYIKGHVVKNCHPDAERDAVRLARSLVRYSEGSPTPVGFSMGDPTPASRIPTRWHATDEFGNLDTMIGMVGR